MPPKGGKSSLSVGSWLPVLNEGAPVSDANPGFFIFSLSFSSALLSKSLKCYLLFCVKISPDALAASAFFWAAAAEGDAGLGPPAGAASFLGFIWPTLKMIFLSKFITCGLDNFRSWK
mmetsp:Transcript_19628/g.26534  ORF Transcript_19628/g.26534 Transcript_19628/m.26534 type:complete len:118 (+) Transcript_19628:961-1314(+)